MFISTSMAYIYLENSASKIRNSHLLWFGNIYEEDPTFAWTRVIPTIHLDALPLDRAIGWSWEAATLTVISLTVSFELILSYFNTWKVVKNQIAQTQWG